LIFILLNCKASNSYGLKQKKVEKILVLIKILDKKGLFVAFSYLKRN